MGLNDLLASCRLVRGDGSAATITELERAISDSRIIYVGEKHDNPMHHSIQRDILEYAHSLGGPIALGMEMLHQDYSDKINIFNNGGMSEEDFVKDVFDKTWGNYPLYKGIIQFASSNRIRLLGIDAPTHLVKKCAMGGLSCFTKDDLSVSPKIIETNDPAYEKRIKGTIRSSHGGRMKVDDARLHNMYEAFCLRNDAMAESIDRRLIEEQGKLLVFAGAGHLDFYEGVPKRTRARNSSTDLIIIPMEEGEYDDYIKNRSGDSVIGDFVLITP